MAVTCDVYVRQAWVLPTVFDTGFQHRASTRKEEFSLGAPRHSRPRPALADLVPESGLQWADADSVVTSHCLSECGAAGAGLAVLWGLTVYVFCGEVSCDSFSSFLSVRLVRPHPC